MSHPHPSLYEGAESKVGPLLRFLIRAWNARQARRAAPDVARRLDENVRAMAEHPSARHHRRARLPEGYVPQPLRVVLVDAAQHPSDLAGLVAGGVW